MIVTPVLIGLIGSALVLGAVLGAILGGIAADRIGRKRAFIVDMAIIVAGAALCNGARTFINRGWPVSDRRWNRNRLSRQRLVRVGDHAALLAQPDDRRNDCVAICGHDPGRSRCDRDISDSSLDHRLAIAAKHWRLVGGALYVCATFSSRESPLARGKNSAR
jgi:Sugar (and other) transporter